MSLIEFKKVKKEYHVGDTTITAVKDCSFCVEREELVVILGPSGAGKTTILNLLGGMDSPSSGQILVDGSAIDQYTKKQLVHYRRLQIGFVFQFYNLIGNLTALENVELACQICPNSLDPATVLEQVGLGDRMHSFPSQLSGGEQQRVAIARAMAKNPKLLLCDEPTGALDYNTSKEILKLIEEVNQKFGCTVILVTHNDAIRHMADQDVRLRDGQIRSIDEIAVKIPAAELEW